MDLKCKKMNCVNNDGCACTKKKIHIDRKCECADYKLSNDLDDKQRQDISKNMFEVAPELHPFRHNKDMDIECSADCLFNSEGKCHSNGISVMNCKHSGVCITNIEP